MKKDVATMAALGFCSYSVIILSCLELRCFAIDFQRNFLKKVSFRTK